MTNRSKEFLMQSDLLLSPVDVGFFHSRAKMDGEELFLFVASLFHGGVIKNVAINGFAGEKLGGTIAQEASPGSAEYRRRLVFLGVPDEKIFNSAPAFQTRQENEEFLRLSEKMNWNSGLIIANPHQIDRAMMGMIKVMGSGYKMEVYKAAPPNVDWSARVYGNQGLVSKPRYLQIEDEFLRILTYQQAGDIASFEKYFDYLGQREKNIPGS